MPDAPRRTLLLDLAALAILAASRWFAFPAGIWDIDEAIFANSLIAFDPTRNYPHPPFFPLWVGLGKAIIALLPSLDPARALQLVSVTFSVLMLWPLTELWARVLPRWQALFAALLFCLMPVPWLLAGRAYTETAATAFLVTAAALWLPREASLGQVVLGSLPLTAALLTRPQWLLVAGAFVVWRAAVGRSWAARLAPLAIPVAVGGPVTAFFVARAGGPGPLLAVVDQHVTYHFGALPRFGSHLADLGILQGCGGFAWGLLWLALAGAGTVVLLNRAETRTLILVLLCTLLLPLLALLLLGQNPTSVRYTVPYFALTSGLVVAAVDRALRRPWLVAATLGGALALLLGVGLPHLGEYRRRPSPALAALNDLEGRDGLLVVADYALSPFVDLLLNQGRLCARVVWHTELPGMADPADDTPVVAIFDSGYLDWHLTGSRTTVYRCEDPWLRRLASPRLNEVTVVEGVPLSELAREVL